MSTRADYTTDEWESLFAAAATAAAATMLADGNGPLGTRQELAAIEASFDQVRAHYPDNELIAILCGARTAEEAQSYTRLHLSPENARNVALAACRRVVGVLEQRTTAQEAAEYKAWVLAVAHQVAEAAREGTGVRRNPDRVSDKERVMLDDLAAALGIPHPDTTV